MKRFFVCANGVDKEIFKVNEIHNAKDRSCYDLNLSFLGSTKSFTNENLNPSFLPLLDTENYDSYKDQLPESHISVHCNPGKESVTIKRTIAMQDGENKTFVQVTPGIKRDKAFVPIIFRFCGNMSNESLNLKTYQNAMSLETSYNPSTDQLRYMLVLSDSNVEFPFDIEHPSNMKSCKFTNFNLTILYSYFNFPSQKQTINFTPYTKKENYNYTRGLEGWEVYNLYTYLYMQYADAYFEKTSLQ